jgi:hypothetical protein
MSFFGGAKEPQDQSMRESMQRESAEELVLIGKHGRPLCDTLVLMCHRALNEVYAQQICTQYSCTGSTAAVP